MFWREFLLGDLRCSGQYSLSWEKELFCWKWNYNGKLGALLKMRLFARDIEGFWILIERTNLKHPCKIRNSGKGLLVFLGYWGVCFFAVFACFLGKWWRYFLYLTNWQAGIYSSLVNWGVLLKSWISWEIHLFSICFLHQNTWLPVLISFKRTWEK